MAEFGLLDWLLGLGRGYLARVSTYLVRASFYVVVWMLALPHDAIGRTEFQKLTAGDGAVNDNFGYSVGISGNTAIVGAWHDDRPNLAGDDAGSAYIFRSDGMGTWSQLDKLTASDAAKGNAFGSAVAIDGNLAVVGALQKGTAGGAYIFQDNGTGDWVQLDTLAGNDATAGAQFGYSVAISGNTAIVGAWQNNSATGAAYVFRDNGAGDWAQIGKLTANDGAAGDRFGISVAISGTTALIGASFDSAMAGPLVGAAYVFEDNGGTWSQVDKLTASDAHLANHFGTSVALDGDSAVIGAPGDATGGAEAGAAYVFRRDASLGWQEKHKLLASDPHSSAEFGSSVGIDGEAVIVGAFQHDDGGLSSGSAYFFSENAVGSWQQVSKLVASDIAAGDALGFSVGLSAGVGLAGVPLSNSVGIDAGAAYLFSVPQGLAGDYNHDGQVDAADFVVWRHTSGQSGLALDADGNGDGTVDSADYSLWQANYGLSVPANPASRQSSAVPEPASIVLVLWAGLLCGRWPLRAK